MDAARTALEAARRAGIEVCFANPGTTEMPLVAALDATRGMRAVLGLFEGVCSGAADGYARMTGRPALTLLHLGPGLANALANLHNARRAHSPVVNLVGDQASWHRAADAPLTSDIAALAGSVGWQRHCTSGAALASDLLDAVGAALGPPGGVATLVVPADFQAEPVAGGAAPPRFTPPPAAAPPAAGTLAAAVEALRRGAALVLGGDALSVAGLRAAARVRAACGSPLFSETFPARVERGAGLPDPPRIPYFPEQARQALAGLPALVLAGARDPVAFFGYPGQPSRLAAESTQVLSLAGPAGAAAALEALAGALRAPAPPAEPARPRPTPGTGRLTTGVLGQTLAALQPEGAIVVDEAATSSLPWTAHAAGAAPHTVLALTGGAIGQGLPCATGAALACPERKVIAFQADGSGLYTLQALWTQARESLDVVTVICANRAYRILQVELARAGVAEPGPQARRLTALDAPPIDWLAAARAFGVPASRVASGEELAQALGRALAGPGPHLIEALLA